MSKKLILASGSPRRKELLERAGLSFDVIPSGYEEDMNLALPPIELVKHLSRGKAEEVAKRHLNAVVLSADTIVAYGDLVLGKPHTPERAKEMLQLLSGKAHSVFTGYTIIRGKDNKVVSRAVETKVYCKELSEREIDEYIETGDPLDKAGAYAIQKFGATVVEKIEGDYDNVVGLPVGEVIKVLRDEFGFI
jgi:septum formation protein